MALQDYYETLYFLEKKKVSDGLGGWVTQYVKGAEFHGMIQRQDAQMQILATQQLKGESWVLVCEKTIDLDVNDVIGYNNATYKVTSNELITPAKASDRVKSHQYNLELLVDTEVV